MGIVGNVLTNKRVDFKPVGGGCSVGGPPDAEAVVSNVVGLQVSHIQVHCMGQEELVNASLALILTPFGIKFELSKGPVAAVNWSSC